MYLRSRHPVIALIFSLSLLYFILFIAFATLFIGYVVLQTIWPVIFAIIAIWAWQYSKHKWEYDNKF